MQKGTIAKLMGDKGFGFIKIDGSDKDLFFHANELVNISFDELKEGDMVEFKEEMGQKGPNAVQINKI